MLGVITRCEYTHTHIYYAGCHCRGWIYTYTHYILCWVSLQGVNIYIHIIYYFGCHYRVWIYTYTYTSYIILGVITGCEYIHTHYISCLVSLQGVNIYIHIIYYAGCHYRVWIYTYTYTHYILCWVPLQVVNTATKSTGVQGFPQLTAIVTTSGVVRRVGHTTQE